jgi:hypothetical protein
MFVPVVMLCAAPAPTAVELDEVVAEVSANEPTATAPVMLVACVSAAFPTATLFEWVVEFEPDKALAPMATS